MRDNRRSICIDTTQVFKDLYQRVYEMWLEVCKIIPQGAVLHCTIQPMGTASIQTGKDQGGVSNGGYHRP
ncbi:hypothetical protein BO85DRAFT_452592 [Aspergillus piperis CBS 112811]|uniref:Uncharacterized protein n=1 Tax=Aspergillus piperis CBS 112811 TaxID=1448313 RepID=A0A8G1QWD1_9EURO|nr:hypothetical protein BO85DRAFT_452592 [Aspergillus piperis CBS 112811]RAH54226.1 hypothetical protein BO85DRAFT_452592 [Aspergillus piperis CBS 112811]